MQLESAFQTNKKKWTADQAFGNDYFDYIYDIVITGTEWHFIIWGLCNRKGGNSKKNKKWVNYKSEQIIVFGTFLAYKLKF